MRILIFEDGSWVADELARMLRRQGGAVELARSSDLTVRAAAVDGYDLLILDLSLSAADSMRLLRALGDLRDRVPLLVLTARGQADERVQALELGADCLGEPFAMREVAARVRALLRRVRPQEEAHRLVHGPPILDVDAHPAHLPREPLPPLPRGWALPHVLLPHAPRPVSQ